MPIIYLPIRSFRSLPCPAPDSVCRRICSYHGKCPGEGGSAFSDWAGPPHPERGPEQLHTLCWRLLLALLPLVSTWELQSQPYLCPHLPYPCPHLLTPNPTPAHICPHLPYPCPHLPMLILPLPTPAYAYPTPAHTCPHLPYPCPHLHMLILPLPT